MPEVKDNRSNTIIFIHGIFTNSMIWKSWINFFNSKGYQCYAPSYPYHEGNPGELRENVDKRLGGLRFKDVTASYSDFIDQLPEKPILIGYSMGGLVVQKLIERNKGLAGICIASAPPTGIISLKWSFIRSNLPVINPFRGNSFCLPSIKWFHYAVCNTFTFEQTKFEYDKLVIPESRNVPRGSLRKEGMINFNKPHNPLLFIAAENDHIIPASLVRKNYKAYKHKSSRIEFKEFKDRTHYICAQENWEEVAAFINDWIYKEIR